QAPFRVYMICDTVEAQNVAREVAARPGLAVQVRDRAASAAAVEQAALALRAAGHRVYVSDRVDIALAVGCEGAQLPGASLSVGEARAVRADRPLLVGVSTHSLDEVRMAREAGADFCVLAPIFATPGKGEPLGVATLAQASRLGIPVYALGG